MKTDSHKVASTQTSNLSYIPRDQTLKNYEQFLRQPPISRETAFMQHHIPRYRQIKQSQAPIEYRLTRTTSMFPIKQYIIEQPMRRQIIKIRESKKLEKPNESNFYENFNCNFIANQKQKLVDQLWELNNLNKKQNQKLRKENCMLREQVHRIRDQNARERGHYKDRQKVWNWDFEKNKEDMLTTYQTQEESTKAFQKKLKKVRSQQIYCSVPDEFVDINSQAYQPCLMNCCDECVKNIMEFHPNSNNRYVKQAKIEKQKQNSVKRAKLQQQVRDIKEQSLKSLISRLKKENKHLKKYLK